MYLLNAYLLTAASGKEFTFCTKTMMDALLAYNNEVKDPIKSVVLLSSDVQSEFNAEDVQGDIPTASSNSLYDVVCDGGVYSFIATTTAEALSYFLEWKEKEPYQICCKVSGIVFPQEPIQ